MIWTSVLNVLFGFISGIFGGLGMGGGTLLIPLLSIFLGMEQKLCQGINLVAFLVMALFSLIIHFKNGYVVTRGIIFIVLSGIVFSVCGALIAGFLPSGTLRIAFGVFLCLLSVYQGIKAIKN